MESKRPRVLVVDDDVTFAKTVAEALRSLGFDTQTESAPERVLTLVSSGSYEVAVVDLVMPTIRGTDLAAKITLACPDTLVVILTGHADVDSAMESMRQGAHLYMRKDRLDMGDFAQTLWQAVRRSWLGREKRDLLARLSESRGLLEALADFVAGLVDEVDPVRLLESLAAAAARLFKADAARALLLQPTPKEGYVVTAAAGADAGTLQGVRLQHGEGLVSLVASEGKSLAMADPASHAAFSRRCDALPTSREGFLSARLQHGLAFGTLTVAGLPHSPFAGEYQQLLARLASHGASALDNALQRERSTNFFTHVSDMLVTLLDGVDVSYSGHSRRVAKLADMLSRRLGLPEKQRRSIHYGALLHDIGKMRVGLDILGSTTLLTPQQRQAVRLHPSYGVDILRPISLWEDVLPVVQSHHERWDGTGYPNGIAGNGIPMGARIVAIAEVFDAMRRGGPWAAPMSIDQALSEISKNAGTQFDGRLAQLFVTEVRGRGPEVLE